MDSSELRAYLSGFISDHKKELFSRIIEKRTRHITIVLEDIYQPHNSNAVIRSCDCFGIQDIHIIENKNSFVTNSHIELGARKWTTIHQYNKQENNTLDCIRHLRNIGYKIVATSPHHAEKPPNELSLETPVAIFFGTEKEGLSKQVMDHADEFIKMPMYGFTESFNISVCAALILYILREKLDKIGKWELTPDEKEDILLQWTRNSLKDPEGLIKRYIEEKGM